MLTIGYSFSLRNAKKNEKIVCYFYSPKCFPIDVCDDERAAQYQKKSRLPHEFSGKSCTKLYLHTSIN